jgi:hypothetical protein
MRAEQIELLEHIFKVRPLVLPSCKVYGGPSTQQFILRK